MKKTIYFIINFIVLSTVLSGCTFDEPVNEAIENTEADIEESMVDDVENSRIAATRIDNHHFVLVDQVTSVQYLMVVRNGGMNGGIEVSPLYQTDGKPYVGAEVTADRLTIEELDNNSSIITDNETGVEYLKVVRNGGVNGGVSVTPLLDTDGNLLTDKKD